MSKGPAKPDKVYDYLSVHYAIRWLMHSVGNRFSGRTRTGCRSPHPFGPHGEPPPATRVFPPDTLADGSHTVTDEILTELLPTRTHRANPRVIKRKMYVYQVKHPPPPRSNTDPLATPDQHRLN